MIIDGKQIAREIEEKLIEKIRGLATPPFLVAFIIGKDLAKESYLKIKQRVAEHIGVILEVATLVDTLTTNQVCDRIKTVANDPLVNGVIMQLPISSHLDIEKVLDAIPETKDPDILSQSAREIFYRGLSSIIPPVPAAIAEIARRENISFKDKKILVIGRGRLVGEPIIAWLRREGVMSVVIDEFTDENSKMKVIKESDIIISGAGKPGIITPEIIKSGVIIFDAGTNDVRGELRGDALPSCANKASLLTPVPGGLGPIVVAKLFENLLILADGKSRIVGA